MRVQSAQCDRPQDHRSYLPVALDRMNWREQDEQYPPSMVSVRGDIHGSAKRSQRGASQSGQIRPLDVVPQSASMPRGRVARRSARRRCTRRRSTPVRASGYLASAWNSSRRSLRRRSRPARRPCPKRPSSVSLLIGSRRLPMCPSPWPATVCRSSPRRPPRGRLTDAIPSEPPPCPTSLIAIVAIPWAASDATAVVRPRRPWSHWPHEP